MRLVQLAGIALAALMVLVTACSADSGGRQVTITQTNDACTPATFQVQTGEKITFEIANQGSKDQELEGIEGTKLEEVKIPAGKTRTANWTAPKDPGTAKFKCYAPGGASTIITADVQ